MLGGRVPPVGRREGVLEVVSDDCDDDDDEVGGDDDVDDPCAETEYLSHVRKPGGWGRRRERAAAGELQWIDGLGLVDVRCDLVRR